jgi:hypothetical protein
MPAFADGMSQFFGAVVTIDVTLPVGSQGGDIKTIQYVLYFFSVSQVAW